MGRIANLTAAVALSAGLVMAVGQPAEARNGRAIGFGIASAIIGSAIIGGSYYGYRRHYRHYDRGYSRSYGYYQPSYAYSYGYYRPSYAYSYGNGHRRHHWRNHRHGW